MATRIKHTPNESYKVYSFFSCKGGKPSWYPYKHYSTKSSALAAIKRYKEDYKDWIQRNNCFIEKNLLWKIVWSPYPFASDEECITVYNEGV